MSDRPLISSGSERKRLPSGQEEREEFPVFSMGSVPDILEDIQIRIFGTIEEEGTFFPDRAVKAIPADTGLSVMLPDRL